MVTVLVRLLVIVIANPKLKSPHFDVCDGHSRAICKICHKRIMRGGNMPKFFNTTNLWKVGYKKLKLLKNNKTKPICQWH